MNCMKKTMFVLAAASSSVAIAAATENVNKMIGTLDAPTASIMSNFVALTDIPRPTFHEKQVSDWMVAWAKAHGFSPTQDSQNNVWFDVPATEGMERKPLTILQGHLDMVAVGFGDPLKEGVLIDCDKDGNVFSKDHKTSVGADDGLAVAFAMTVAEGKIPHGPVRVLLTTDEEEDQQGARAVPPKVLAEAAYCINIDTEVDGQLTISSAASDTFILTGAVTTVESKYPKAYRIDFTDFRGGHSGLAIHCGHLNAIIEMGRVLTNAVARGIAFDLVELTGGDAYNAIPPHAAAVIRMNEADLPAFEKLLSAAKADFVRCSEKDANVKIVAADAPSTALSPESCRGLLAYLTTVHNGVWNWSKAMPDLVETSVNLGKANVTASGVWFTGAARGSVNDRILEEEASLVKTAAASGYTYSFERTAAPWPVDTANPLIGLFTNAWMRVVGTKMSVVAIHAGLECGGFVEKAPALKVVSVGAQIDNPHTVSETTNIASINRLVKVMAAVLADMPTK